jgi:hypothetical protein
VKSSNHWPTEVNRMGAWAHTTSSATSARRSTASAGATGTASTIRAAPSRRTTRIAARTVAPVAMPSSTTTTVRSRRLSRGPPGRSDTARRVISARS